MSQIIDLKKYGQALAEHFGAMQIKHFCFFPEGVAVDVRWYDREMLSGKAKSKRHLWRGYEAKKIPNLVISGENLDALGMSLSGVLLIRDHYVAMSSRPKEYDFVGVILSGSRARNFAEELCASMQDVFCRMTTKPIKQSKPESIDPEELARIGNFLWTLSCNLRLDAKFSGSKSNQFLPEEPWGK